MKRIAIISFFHYETSLCLAKYIAKQGFAVDYYAMVDYLRDKGVVSGFKYNKAKKALGLHHLVESEIPEIYGYSKGLDVNYNLLRILSYSSKAFFLNKIILRRCLKKMESVGYEAINLIGQHPWISFIHTCLDGQNIVHTFHEVGSHQSGKCQTPLMELVICDRSKVILPSSATYNAFLSLPDANKCNVAKIPFGKMETLLLYNSDVKLQLKVDISKPTFLFYGFIKPYKGLDLLARAMGELENEFDKFNLVIAGGGHDESIPYFQSLPNCDVINRYLTNEEMMALNKMAKAVLLPYKSASQSGIVTNTFLYGKPIIGTRVGALSEVIIDNVNGLLVDIGDYKGFARAMKRILSDCSLYDKLCNGALSFGSGDEYDWNTIAHKTLDFILNKRISKAK